MRKLGFLAHAHLGKYGSTLSKIAILTKRLKVDKNRLAPIRNGENVIGVKFNHKARCRASATRKTTETVPHEHLEAKTGANVPIIGFSPIRPSWWFLNSQCPRF